MVNGCFWHGHKGCRYAAKPKTNADFWDTKILKNRHRDEVTDAHLEALGWTVITVWECELRGKGNAESRIDLLAVEIRKAGEKKTMQEQERKLIRAAIESDAVKNQERRKALENEVRSKYQIPGRINVISKNEE